MQKRCDLYFSEPVTTDRRKLVGLYDKSFAYAPGKTYVGFLQVNVNRVKLVAVVTDLRKHGIKCFSVPVEYRDRENVSMSKALFLANEHAKSLKASAGSAPRGSCPPVIWCFDLQYEDRSGERSGAVAMIDRIDGHVWTYSEYEEYMYDYNNVL